ncbi:putative nucleic acid-binding Zn ribbon protein [Cricetibacter osteomyelitidis]|uniref:Putative nucleic acid-binding Zn ribbon protein n=1 Tax=Cricetibacter osteomyelitidis TaxID=1521931 RepID=A0A4R2SPD8_9PAST|nr:Zn-ribbon-containing protein [Cricetibacter osteomyelitidis]TCP91999.1 putative nucleic acid-binding Zn ribbon protein [Cricetibacter osteomyelitidis]
MYLAEVFFRLTAEQYELSDASKVINPIIDQWRYNGQIIGREIPLFYAEKGERTGFMVRATCPEPKSLLPEWNNVEVNNALENAAKAGIYLESIEIFGDDLNSDTTSQTDKPEWQILCTTYLQSCSPIHSGDDFLPIPLYKQLKNIPHLSMDVIKWQENWQACDQLQMNGSVLEQQAINEISSIDGNLTKHGRYLAAEIEKESGVPTYYYLYRVGGESLEAEQNRCCPSCGNDWKLEKPLFDFIYFKCDQCRLISNLSWSFGD